MYPESCRCEQQKIFTVQQVKAVPATINQSSGRIMAFALVISMATLSSKHLDPGWLYPAVAMVMALKDGFLMRYYFAIKDGSELVTTLRRIQVVFVLSQK